MSDDLGVGLHGFTPEELEELRSNPELRALFDADSGDYPDTSNRDSLLKLFRDVLSFKDKVDYEKINKTGNLKDFEIGSLPIGTRGYLSIAKYAASEGLVGVAGYLRSQANIISFTSLSRAAALLKLVVTQRKFSGVISPKTTQVKKGFFGERTIESGGEE